MPKTKLKIGDWKATCDICGFDFHASELRKNWRNLYVCKKDFEPREELDFLRGIPDDPSVPWVRKDNTDFSNLNLTDADVTVQPSVNASVTLSEPLTQNRTLLVESRGSIKGDTFSVFRTDNSAFDLIVSGNDNYIADANDFTTVDWQLEQSATVTPNTDIAPDGTLTADSLNDPSTGNAEITNTVLVTSTNFLRTILYIKKTSPIASYPRLRLVYSPLSSFPYSFQSTFYLDTATGDILYAATPETYTTVNIEEENGYWKIIVDVDTEDNLTQVRFDIFPAITDVWVAGTSNPALTGSIVAWGASVTTVYPSTIEAPIVNARTCNKYRFDGTNWLLESKINL